MKRQHQQSQTARFAQFTRLRAYGRFLSAVLLLGMSGTPLLTSAQSTWNGSASTDWNTAANWSAGVPSGVNAVILSNAPNIATITTTIAATPVDIMVATGAGTTGQVNHISGNASTGDGNWMILAWQGGNSTYNLADTTAAGGTFTGYGQGSGNVNVGGTLLNGNVLVGVDGGTISKLNINTSGTLAGGGMFVSCNGNSTGTVNMDNGTVNLSGEAQIGSSFWGNGFSGRLNMSGGTFTADIVSFGRGNNNAANITGIGNLTGGALNSGRWFTLAFAGSSSTLAAVTNNGATINVNTAGGGNMEMGVWDPAQARFVLNSGSVTIQNNASIQFGVLGQSGSATFDQNGGTVTFYADAGTTVGGSGGIVLGSQGAQPWEISSGTYAYNLNAGTLTVPQISKLSPNASGTFNFNGGTLKPTATTATFMQGLTAANVLASGGTIDTDGYDVTIAQGLAGTGQLTKIGVGTLTLSGTSTHTGNILITAGPLALSGTATLASTVVIPSGQTLDVTGLTVGLQNPISGTGAVNGSAIGAAGLAVYPATDGTVGTLTFNNNLDTTAGGSLRFDLSTSHLSGNDQVVVSGNLSVSSATVIRIKALSGAANLSTAGDYVLCSVAGTTTMATTPALAWDGTPPANYLNFSVAQVGNNLVLKFVPFTAPTVTATSTPATVVRNQSVNVTATVTPGSGSVTNVQIDASQLGGSATASLVLSATANVYTNTFVVPTSLTPGVKLMTIVAMANTGLNSPGYTVTNTVVATNEVWTGAGANDNWTTNPNWNNASPAASGDAVTFAGTTRLTPNMDANYSLTGVTFAPAAGSFNISSGNGSTLTLTAGSGVVNNSANAQTLNVPITQTSAQTYDAAAGNLVINQPITKSGNLVTVTGGANTVLGGAISDSGSLYKRGSGSLTISNNSNWDLNQASSGGFSGPLIAQAGTLTFNNGSSHSVSGELVIGGVIANGGQGNNAAIIVDNATLNVSSWLSIGRGNGTGTVSSVLILTNGASVTAANASAGFNGGSGANKPKGSVSLYDTSSLTINGDFHVAEAAGANFDVNVNGSSTLTYNNFMDLCIGFGGTIANMNVNGGTVNCGGDPFIGHWGDGTATLNINSGAFNVGTSVERWMFMGYWDRVNGVININGGSLNFWNNSKLRMARNVNHGGNVFSHVINHNSGNVTYYSDAGTTEGGGGLLDMQYDGAAQGSTTYNLNGGTLSVPSVMSSVTTGKRTFNFNGGTLKAAAAGTLMDLGAGDAHAYVRTNGAIIDDNGNAITIPTALEHLSGDFGDGGLRKLGSGTLNLTGANSYKGNTIVAAGILELAQATLASTSTVSVSNSAFLQLDFATTNHVSALVLAGIAQPSGVYNNANTPSYILGTGSLLVHPVASYPTNITSSVAGNTLSLSWPDSHLSWVLQAQTNGINTGLSTNWSDIAGSASVTNMDVTIDPNQPTVFYRMRNP